MKIKKHVILLLIPIMLLFALPLVTLAKGGDDIDTWLKESMNPAVTDIVGKFNETSQMNWYVNLSTYLIEGDRKDAIKNLKVLRRDIKRLKKDVKRIKHVDSAVREERKQVKTVKNRLNNALIRTDRGARKIIKRLDKDKKVTSVSARKREAKQVSKANDAYSKLNDWSNIKYKDLNIIGTVKIDKSEAKDIIELHEKEQKKKKKEKAIKKEESRVMKAKVDAPKIEVLQSDIEEIVSMSDGLIKDIKPQAKGGWDIMNVFVDDSWHSESDEEKQRAAETIGLVVESLVVDSGLSGYSVIQFIDEKGNNVASQKALGGYRINE